MNIVQEIVEAVDPARIRRDLFYLAQDPLPCRVLNHTISGHQKCTLWEADDFIAGVLTHGRYHLSRDFIPVQAFVPDSTVSWGFRKPCPQEPWYDAVNIFGTRPGSVRPSELVILVAHKDSQSWLDRAPGAYDNAVGVVALLEISRLLANCELHRTLMFLFCNEEHWPWTSVAAAEKVARSGLTTVAVLNLDSLGGKASEEVAAGRLTNTVRFSTTEGERLANVVEMLNEEYSIGLSHTKVSLEIPNDDDGSFVRAGIPPSILLIGSYPYSDPNYHTVNDRPENVDLENVRRCTQLALATVLTLCV